MGKWNSRTLKMIPWRRLYQFWSILAGYESNQNLILNKRGKIQKSNKQKSTQVRESDSMQGEKTRGGLTHILRDKVSATFMKQERDAKKRNIKKIKTALRN